mgnify:CR=1 FL=1
MAGFGVSTEAPDAAPHDVLSRDDGGVIHDVFPRRGISPWRPIAFEAHAAIDRSAVPLDGLLFKPPRDVPTIHDRSP